jgi:hypothetical protein
LRCFIAFKNVNFFNQVKKAMQVKRNTCMASGSAPQVQTPQALAPAENDIPRYKRSSYDDEVG